MRNKEKLSSDFNPVEDMYGLPSQAVLEKDDTEIEDGRFTSRCTWSGIPPMRNTFA